MDAGTTPEPHGEEGLTGRRATARVRLALPARIETIRGMQSVTLVNLSQTGAQVAAEEVPAAGSELVLMCGAIDVFATVKWSRDGRCGLRFDEPVGREELLSLRQEADAAARAPDAAQWRAAREWAAGR